MDKSCSRSIVKVFANLSDAVDCNHSRSTNAVDVRFHSQVGINDCAKVASVALSRNYRVTYY